MYVVFVQCNKIIFIGMTELSKHNQSWGRLTQARITRRTSADEELEDFHRCLRQSFAVEVNPFMERSIKRIIGKQRRSVTEFSQHQDIHKSYQMHKSQNVPTNYLKMRVSTLLSQPPARVNTQIIPQHIATVNKERLWRMLQRGRENKQTLDRLQSKIHRNIDLRHQRIITPPPVLPDAKPLIDRISATLYKEKQRYKRRVNNLHHRLSMF